MFDGYMVSCCCTRVQYSVGIVEFFPSGIYKCCWCYIRLLGEISVSASVI